MEPACIADCIVQQVGTLQEFSFKQLWKDQTCVIVFLRRFGWPLLRLAARQISQIRPQLQLHNVRLIGIGLEPLGLDEFLEGEFFSGELFIDQNKTVFSALGLKRLSFLQLFPAVFSKKSREANSEAKSLSLGGNLKGDGYQNGGCLVVGPGGSPTIFSFRQEDVADQPDNNKILQALGITPTQSSEEA